NSGFPNDDVNTLQQLASGDANLDIYYSHQMVENESTSTDPGGDTLSVFSPLEHTPILAGTVTGVIYDDSVGAVQNFVIDQSGNVTLTDIGAPATKVSSMTLDLTTGEMTLTWNGDPGANHVVIS